MAEPIPRQPETARPDISNASRAIEPEEADCLEKANIDFTEFQIGVDGLAVVVHPETDWLDCMTFEELNAIYAPGSKVETWQDTSSLSKPRLRETFAW